MQLPTKRQCAAAILTVLVCAAMLGPAFVRAQDLDPKGTNYGLDEFTNVGIGQETDLKATIAQIINIVLGFLGIVAVVIIIIGGFRWMTAAGNEEQVEGARKMIVQAVAGLVIIFMAWVIAAFVIGQLRTATNA